MQDWSYFWGALRRRWWLLLLVFAVVALASGYQFLKARRHLGFQACATLYVSDVSSPSLTYGASGATDVLLAGETAANFFADDVLDVSESSRVARYLSAEVKPLQLPSTAFSDINGSIGGSRRDRTVNVCVNNPARSSALALGQRLGQAWQSRRQMFVGRQMAKRTFVKVVSGATVAPAAPGQSLLSLALRLILGLLVASGAALLWDALDPRVRDVTDVETSLGAPVLLLASSRRRSAS